MELDLRINYLRDESKVKDYTGIAYTYERSSGSVHSPFLAVLQIVFKTIDSKHMHNVQLLYKDSRTREILRPYENMCV